MIDLRSLRDVIVGISVLAIRGVLLTAVTPDRVLMLGDSAGAAFVEASTTIKPLGRS